MISVSDVIGIRDIEDATWYIECEVFDIPPKAADIFIIGESPDANDGPPADLYDVPQCPQPPAPYILAFLDDNLILPYDKLTSDFRFFPDNYKIFNLTIIHDFTGVNSTSHNLSFNWQINGFNEIEYSNIELINTRTQDHFSLFEQNSLILTVGITGISNYKIICDLVHIKLDKNWNFISPYCNIDNEKIDSFICYDNTTMDWSEAVNNGIIVDSAFTWDNLNQTYMFSNTFNSGKGYWVYANSPCYLWLKNYTIHSDDTITELQKEWNIIGSPFNKPVCKNNITIEWNNTNYSWSNAINTGIINTVFHSWNATIQSYEFSNSLEPEKAYWLYAYEPCRLKKTS